jgi:Uma2 family endonuclease
MPLEAPIAPTKESLLDRWRNIISWHPELFEDVAERIETDAFGNILMSPSPDGAHQKRELRIAPEICIEVRSPGNTIQELYEKRDAYFRAGAREVWICDLSNQIALFNESGELNKSELCPDFPAVIELYRSQQAG